MTELYFYAAALLIGLYLGGHFLYAMGVDAGRRDRRWAKAWKTKAKEYRLCSNHWFEAYMATDRVRYDGE